MPLPRSSRWLSRLFVVLGLVLLSAQSPAIARAQGAAAEGEEEAAAGEAGDEWRTMLVEGLHEFDTGNYAEAYALFLRVHEAAPSARTERALGNTAFELRRYLQAIEWLELALDDQRSPLTDSMRAEVMGLLRRARAFIGHFVVVVTNVEHFTLTADGHEAEPGNLSLDIGEHHLVIDAPGYERLDRAVTVTGGEDERIEVTLERTPIVGGTRPDPGAIYRDIGWAGVIAGGALAIGGAVAAGIWADTVGTLNANIEAGACLVDPMTENVVRGTPNDAICLDLESRYRIALPFAWIGLVTGGVLLATGLGLVAGAPRPDDGDTVTVACGPFADGGVMCRGTF